MSKARTKIYDGSSKAVYSCASEDTFVQFFKDEFVHRGIVYSIAGKGVINNSISSILMQALDAVGIEHHFMEKINMREQVVYAADVFPVQVCVTNVAVDRYVTDYGIAEGYVFERAMLDFRMRSKI